MSFDDGGVELMKVRRSKIHWIFFLVLLTSVRLDNVANATILEGTLPSPSIKISVKTDFYQLGDRVATLSLVNPDGSQIWEAVCPDYFSSLFGDAKIIGDFIYVHGVGGPELSLTKLEDSFVAKLDMNGKFIWITPFSYENVNVTTFSWCIDMHGEQLTAVGMIKRPPENANLAVLKRLNKPLLDENYPITGRLLMILFDDDGNISNTKIVQTDTWGGSVTAVHCTSNRIYIGITAGRWKDVSAVYWDPVGVLLALDSDFNIVWERTLGTENLAYTIQDIKVNGDRIFLSGEANLYEPNKVKEETQSIREKYAYWGNRSAFLIVCDEDGNIENEMNHKAAFGARGRELFVDEKRLFQRVEEIVDILPLDKNPSDSGYPFDEVRKEIWLEYDL